MNAREPDRGAGDLERSVPATQNPSGGFGCGVHNPDEPLQSSACEDSDSSDPLCRSSRWVGSRGNPFVARECSLGDTWQRSVHLNRR